MDQRLKIGITHGDINGISYEVILKMLQDTRLLELFTPVVYGSAKVAGYYRKALNIESEPWNRIKHPSEAVDTDSTPYLINCTDDDIQVEMGKPTAAGGSAAYAALDQATTDLLNRTYCTIRCCYRDHIRFNSKKRHCLARCSGSRLRYCLTAYSRYVYQPSCGRQWTHWRRGEPNYCSGNSPTPQRRGSVCLWAICCRWPLGISVTR